MNGLDLLARIIADPAVPHAILHRPEANGRGCLDIFTGTLSTVPTLAEIPLREALSSKPHGHESLVLIPFRQIAERGFAVNDDGAPLMVLSIAEQGQVSIDDVLSAIPDRVIDVAESGFDISDEDYAAFVRNVMTHEIAAGEGSNFVVKRSFFARIYNHTENIPLILFRKLLNLESGAYWTFLIGTGSRAFVGATPERHVSLADGRAVMNPISGTYRYPAAGPSVSGIVKFLSDRKETDELTMVVDEELKMMGRICHEGGRVTGPHLREMARLAHTEYYIEGETALDARSILSETLFAPTVTGSPLENACRVIARHEPAGRGYYGGVAALIGRQANGRQCMDSAIMIRTADIAAADTAGESILKLGVGATLVRHSDPASEARETHAKAAGMLAALGSSAGAALPSPAARINAANHPQVRAALECRNATLSRFWLAPPALRRQPHPALVGLKALVVDAEDTFTAMLGHQLSAIGLDVEIVGHDAALRHDTHDLLVLGPGPGDPRDESDARVGRLSALASSLLAKERPFLAVCLSHQILSARLGLDLVRRDVPNQGYQAEIDLFGTMRRVGFYNSFIALSPRDRIEHPLAGPLDICRNPGTREVYAIRGRRFASVQFHAESVLTQHGPEIFAELLAPILKPATMEAVA